MNVMARLVIVGLVLLIAALAGACGGSGGSSSSPTAPTAAAPAGCSGRAVPQVEVSFSGGMEGTGIMIQLFGETFNQQIASGETFRVTRAVVPCNYEITGQMLGRSLSVRFALTSPFESRSAGVEKGSVVIDEGPNGVFGPAELACAVRFNATGGPNAPAPPFNIKIRFRVATSNAVDDRGGGCG
jgi:hypothetical protein